jgi:hypothetical protein
MLAKVNMKMARAAMGQNMVVTPARGIKLHEY